MNARELRLVQLALKGRIITPVSPLEAVAWPWTEFTDKWAGGCAKEPWDHILIQASPKVACAVFEHVFEHHPRNISCSCCGEEYFVTQTSDIDYANSLFIQAADILSEWVKSKADFFQSSLEEIHVVGSLYPVLFLHKAPSKTLDGLAALHGMSPSKIEEMNPKKLKEKFTTLFTGTKKKGQ